MIAAAKPTCPHCGAICREEEAGSNAAFDWVHRIFDCGTSTQVYAETGAIVCETRSARCNTTTGTIEKPERRARYGSKLSRRAGIAAMNKLIG